MKSFGSVLVVVAALCGAGTAAAQDQPWYAGVAGGRLWPETSDDGLRKEQKPGPIGEVRIGWRASPGIAVEGAFGGFHVEDNLPPVDVSETTLGSLSATWFAATVKVARRAGSDRLRAFAGGGVGQYRFDAHLKDPPSTRREASEKEFGMHLVGGVEFDATRRIGLGLEYRWLSIESEGVELGGGAALINAVYRF